MIMYLTNCCLKKADVENDYAHKLYKGMLFNLWKRIVSLFTKNDLKDFWIISAKYGLINAYDKIDNYDQFLNEKIEVEIPKEYDTVIVFITKEYLKKIKFIHNENQKIINVCDFFANDEFKFKTMRMLNIWSLLSWWYRTYKKENNLSYKDLLNYSSYENYINDFAEKTRKLEAEGYKRYWFTSATTIWIKNEYFEEVTETLKKNFKKNSFERAMLLKKINEEFPEKFHKISNKTIKGQRLWITKKC